MATMARKRVSSLEKVGAWKRGGRGDVGVQGLTIQKPGGGVGSPHPQLLP